MSERLAAALAELWGQRATAGDDVVEGLVWPGPGSGAREMAPGHRHPYG